MPSTLSISSNSASNDLTPKNVKRTPVMSISQANKENLGIQVQSINDVSDSISHSSTSTVRPRPKNIINIQNSSSKNSNQVPVFPPEINLSDSYTSNCDTVSSLKSISVVLPVQTSKTATATPKNVHAIAHNGAHVSASSSLNSNSSISKQSKTPRFSVPAIAKLEQKFRDRNVSNNRSYQNLDDIPMSPDKRENGEFTFSKKTSKEKEVSGPKPEVKDRDKDNEHEDDERPSSSSVQEMLASKSKSIQQSFTHLKREVINNVGTPNIKTKKPKIQKYKLDKVTSIGNQRLFEEEEDDEYFDNQDQETSSRSDSISKSSIRRSKTSSNQKYEIFDHPLKDLDHIKSAVSISAVSAHSNNSSQKSKNKEIKKPCKLKGILKNNKKECEVKVNALRIDTLNHALNLHTPETQNREHIDRKNSNPRSVKSINSTIQGNLNKNQLSKSTWSFASADSNSNRSLHHGKWWNHPKVQNNLKVVISCFVLIIVGIILLILGSGLIANKKTHFIDRIVDKIGSESGSPVTNTTSNEQDEDLDDGTGSIAFYVVLIVVGIMFTMPSAYYLFAVYASVRGKSGYRFYNLPAFN